MPLFGKKERSLRRARVSIFNPESAYQGQGVEGENYPIRYECYKPSSGKVKPNANCKNIPKPIISAENNAQAKAQYNKTFYWLTPEYAEKKAAEHAKSLAKLNAMWSTGGRSKKTRKSRRRN